MTQLSAAIFVAIFCTAAATVSAFTELHEVHSSSWSGDGVRNFSLKSMDRSGGVAVLNCASLAAKHLTADQLLVVVEQAGTLLEPQCIVANRNGAVCRRLMPSQKPSCCVRVFTKSLSNCWISIQRRVDNTIDFYRNWSEYARGFGEGPHTNHWLGLRLIHSLTHSTGRKLRIHMKSWADISFEVYYTSFYVANEANKFQMTVSGFHTSSSGIGDCLKSHSGMFFTTPDVDNDHRAGANCCSEFRGGWWYRGCHCTNPNGVYFVSPYALNATYGVGIVWYHNFGDHYSLKEFEMLIN